MIKPKEYKNESYYHKLLLKVITHRYFKIKLSYKKLLH